MQLLHLKYFKLMAENEHLMRTAQQIHISPPALSSTISKLEKELGVKLFDRTGRNIRLNENGRMLYVHVCNIMNELDQIERDLNKSKPAQQDILRIAVTAPTLWNEVIGAFINANPNVQIVHSAVPLSDLSDNDKMSQFDLILTADVDAVNHKVWESQFVVEDPPMLLVSKNHPFASRSSVSLYEARNEAFVALSKAFSSRQSFENACGQAGFVPRVVAEGDYLLRTQLIENGVGIAFSSVLGAKAFANSNVAAVRVKYPPNPRMQTVFWKSGTTQSSLSDSFREFLSDFYADGVAHLQP